MSLRNRPISPHLQVHKFYFPSVLSIAHRLTGVFWFISLCMLCALPVLLAYDVCSLAEWPLYIKHALFFITTLLFVYHAFNGIRHIMWDLGYGFSLKSTYITGGLVCFLSLSVTIMIFVWIWL